MTIDGVFLNAPSRAHYLPVLRRSFSSRLPAHAEQDTEKEDETNEQVLSEEAVDEVASP